MKVSWRNAGETPGTLEHFHNFAAGEKCEGRNLREFMVYLIRQTHASEIALDDKVVWGLKDGYNAEDVVFRALVPAPRQARALITIDYTREDDWLDYECRSCGGLYGTHRQCGLMSGIDKGWLDVVESAHGR